MTHRHGHDSQGDKAAPERDLKQMEGEELWSCVAVTEVSLWERAVSEPEDGYISAFVYLNKKLQV